MAIATLRPSGDGTLNGWTRIPASGTWASKIVDDPDSHDGDTSYVLSTNILDDQMFVDIDNVPADFDPDSINSITLKAAAKFVNTPQMAVDTCDLYMQLFRVDETTAISDESTVANVTDDTSYVLFSRSPAASGSHSVADWNGCRLRLRQDYTSQQTPDDVAQIRVTAAEVIVDYNPLVLQIIPDLIMAPRRPV